MEKMKKTTVIIVGGGASGLSASIFLAKAKVDHIVFDHDKTTLRRAYIKNYPGQIEPFWGLDLRNSARQLSEQYGGQIICARVMDIRCINNEISAITEGNSEYISTYLIIATGQAPIHFPSLGLKTIPGVQPYVKVNIPTSPIGETNIPNVFAVGVVAGHPSQAIVAAGDGARVAVHIISRIKGEYWVDHDDPPASDKRNKPIVKVD